MIGKYLLRSLKYLVYLCCIIVFLLAVVYFTSSHAQGLRFTDLIDPSKQKLFALFLLAVAAIYPTLGFGSHQLWSNSVFCNDKDLIKSVMQNAGYVITYEDEHILKFRPRNMMARIRRFFEDELVFDGHNNPILLSGMRKDIVRFANRIALELRKDGQADE